VPLTFTLLTEAMVKVMVGYLPASSHWLLLRCPSRVALPLFIVETCAERVPLIEPRFFGSSVSVPLTPSAVPLIFSSGASLVQLNWFLPTLSLSVTFLAPEALTERACPIREGAPSANTASAAATIVIFMLFIVCIPCWIYVLN
jgi:hypothetical protein